MQIEDLINTPKIFDLDFDDCYDFMKLYQIINKIKNLDHLNSIEEFIDRRKRDICSKMNSDFFTNLKNKKFRAVDHNLFFTIEIIQVRVSYALDEEKRLILDEGKRVKIIANKITYSDSRTLKNQECSLYELIFKYKVDLKNPIMN